MDTVIEAKVPKVTTHPDKLLRKEAPMRTTAKKKITMIQNRYGMAQAMIIFDKTTWLKRIKIDPPGYNVIMTRHSICIVATKKEMIPLKGLSVTGVR